MSRNFLEDVGGYELPDNVPSQVESSSQEYYKHPRGINFGFIGKLTAKFKDVNGKRCEADEPGAQLSHFTLPFWIQKSMGTSDAPMERVLIKPNLELPDCPIAETYFPQYLPITPDRQWSIQRLFEKLKVKEAPQYDVVKTAPDNPLKKITDFKALTAWYGIPVKFFIDYKEASEKQSRYVTGLEVLTFDRIPAEALAKFEADVNAKFEAEQKERKEKKDGYIPEAPPETNIDDLLNEEESSNLDDFLK